ncbi:meprin A subunit beta-like [Macrotis lagotis]|uniref:meprin A subunit beta-like n=1 Tax=Macrotis lagotis TaxID=92651 RepID=UPI003D68927B
MGTPGTCSLGCLLLNASNLVNGLDPLGWGSLSSLDCPGQPCRLNRVWDIPIGALPAYLLCSSPTKSELQEPLGDLACSPEPQVKSLPPSVVYALGFCSLPWLGIQHGFMVFALASALWGSPCGLWHAFTTFPQPHLSLPLEQNSQAQKTTLAVHLYLFPPFENVETKPAPENFVILDWKHMIIIKWDCDQNTYNDDDDDDDDDDDNKQITDVYGGKDMDIIEINKALGLNLFEGDVNLETGDRSTLIDDKYKWPLIIPYVLEDNLDMNAKGVILKTFERFRLKTCIDFKPWEGEDNYLALLKGLGCYSSIGNIQSGRQIISIGEKCDTIASVQHELLHTLGFWHEHSRSDRDDYIIIMKDRILPGTENNFYKKSEKDSNSLNIPYDYTSLMHYSKTAFQRGTEPTIITKIPSFMDVIGQRIDFSNDDVEKLNLLYKCSSSLTFLDSCDFELESICGMIQNSEDNGDWERIALVPGGPDTDQTYLGKCEGCGFFMHFSSRSVNIGGNAILESRLFIPKREFQCLEFYYYISGNKYNQLKIYVRKYISEHGESSLILVDEVKDVHIGTWQLYYVPLAINTKFRVVFEGTRGRGTPAGGISIDDINLSETYCPHHMWKISNFKQLVSSGEIIYSPPFYSPAGYAFQIQLDLSNQTEIDISFFQISGANDEKLQWPCPWLQATMTILDQNPDIRQRMSNERSVTTDPFQKTGNESFFWDKPSKVGVKATFPNGTSYIRGRGNRIRGYITHQWIQRRDFIKGDNVHILWKVDDISHLRVTEPSFIPLKVPEAKLCSNTTCENDGICVVRNYKAECRCRSGENWWNMGEKCEIVTFDEDILIIKVLFPSVLFIIMLIVTFVSVHFVKKKYS